MSVTLRRHVGVGLGGLEPPTSSLSAKRSNRLSYRPLNQAEQYPTVAPYTKTGPAGHCFAWSVGVGEGDLDAADQVGAQVVDE